MTIDASLGPPLTCSFNHVGGMG